MIRLEEGTSGSLDGGVRVEEGKDGSVDGGIRGEEGTGGSFELLGNWDSFNLCEIGDGVYDSFGDVFGGIGTGERDGCLDNVF